MNYLYEFSLEMTIPNVVWFNYCKYFKILNTSCLPKRHRQTGHIEISPFRVFSVCYSDMHFVNSSPDNQKFVEYKQRNMFQVLEYLLNIV